MTLSQKRLLRLHNELRDVFAYMFADIPDVRVTRYTGMGQSVRWVSVYADDPTLFVSFRVHIGALTTVALGKGLSVRLTVTDVSNATRLIEEDFFLLGNQFFGRDQMRRLAINAARAQKDPRCARVVIMPRRPLHHSAKAIALAAARKKSV